MSELPKRVTSRRNFLQQTALGAGAVMVSGAWRFPFAANEAALIDGVGAACGRLAPLGWRQLLLNVTAGGLDIAAADLAEQLARPLRIDRSQPGFGDFNAAGTRAIEAGAPGRSLLYHAFASPGVSASRGGAALRGFPTLAEIEAVENYVYGVQPPTLESLRARAGGRPLGIVVFALQYRNTPHSVHGRHAELCFSRTGIARIGTLEPLYDPRARSFESADPARPFDFRVVPQRFAAYIAMQAKGDAGSFGPQDALQGDDQLSFWVPLHKLFNGAECIAGTDIALEVVRDLRNDALAQFHKWLDVSGYQNHWRGEDLEQFPFLIRNERIASFSTRADFGAGIIEPRPAPLANVAEYQGRRLTWTVDPAFSGDPGNFAFSSAQVIPGEPTITPSYMYDTAQETQRPAPEYLNLRHRVHPDGTVDNLNLLPEMMEVIRAGNYQAQHHIDFVGDGWVEARCSALEAAVPTRVPAYAVVAPPDFFPRVSQRDLMSWWGAAVPQPVRAALWAIPPLTLSQTRIAANITLPINFSLTDTTVTAIVTQPAEGSGPVQAPNGPLPENLTGLPDTSPGLFDPGWDTSQGIYFTDAATPLQKFLAGYGLGAPFVEDAKLCAAYGAYWPGVSPDATRTFQPGKSLSGITYPWPTIAPLTDEEIGIVPSADGRYMPWDGVRGPSVRTVDGRQVAAYTDAMRVDYLDMLGTMTAALTSRIDLDEYTARVMAMSRVYWSVGIHDPEIEREHPTDHEEAMIQIMAAKSKWAVRSFQPVAARDASLAAAERAAGVRLTGPKRYRFEVFRWGEQTTDPQDMRVVLVEMLETAVAYVDANTVLIRRDEGPWTHDRSIPTS
ncbi:MAG TPA: twin-arginine translocation signal domain-containing protein [Longimicrobiaceae bacterium]|nr:twin-arginine translocation signal domain-containing protein [Longimicrobiaceae bacterium]